MPIYGYVNILSHEQVISWNIICGLKQNYVHFFLGYKRNYMLQKYKIQHGLTQWNNFVSDDGIISMW